MEPEENETIFDIPETLDMWGFRIGTEVDGDDNRVITFSLIDTDEEGCESAGIFRIVSLSVNELPDMLETLTKWYINHTIKEHACQS